MLLPLISRIDHGDRELPPYDRWGEVVDELRAELEQRPELPVAGLEEYLDEIEPEFHGEALQDLIAEHLRFTWLRGVGIRLEEYVQQFGSRFEVLARLSQLPAELIEDEFLARNALPGGDAPSLQEYERRFPGRDDALMPLRRRMLGGRYVKLRRLGLGATGEVWEARDLLDGRLVAIKLLRSEWSADGPAMKCFVEEAEIAASLEHPGIVRVHDFVREEGSAPYLVLGLVVGRTLGELIADYHYPKVCRSRREKRVRWEELLDLFETVCSAVGHAHSRLVVHRDLKAGNVAVEAGGAAVILDWGLAVKLRADGGVAEGGAVGTPECMAPEQALGMADERSDVFGLGAILYEIVSGRALRSWGVGSRPEDWQRVVMEEELVPARSVNSSAPKGLDEVCGRCLARKREQRIASAEEVLGEVRAYRARAGGGGLVRRVLGAVGLV